MSNQRETIIAAFRTFLDNISTSTGYNNTPNVYREREHFENINSFPALFVEETEPEAVERLSFNQYQGTIGLTIMGAVRSTSKTAIHTLMEDVRICLDSTLNTYREYTSIDSMRPITEPESERQYFESAVRVIYFYNAGSA